MKFRPCIDIHNGKVKQIVGGTLKDSGAKENFISEKGAEYFASLYKIRSLYGGHIILLNKRGTDEYEADKLAATAALSVFKGGLQIGGGITNTNAEEFLSLGASHVIVTSFAFEGGDINIKNLESLKSEVGKEHLVLDLSCRRKDNDYCIVCDRWQRFTQVKLDKESVSELSAYCDELLVHAVDAEGKQRGIENGVLKILSNVNIPATYAGGISSFEDIDTISTVGKGKVDFTIGSALDLFGGRIPFEEVAKYNC